MTGFLVATLTRYGPLILGLMSALITGVSDPAAGVGIAAATLTGGASQAQQQEVEAVGLLSESTTWADLARPYYVIQLACVLTACVSAWYFLSVGSNWLALGLLSAALSTLGLKPLTSLLQWSRTWISTQKRK